MEHNLGLPLSLLKGVRGHQLRGARNKRALEVFYRYYLFVSDSQSGAFLAPRASSGGRSRRRVPRCGNRGAAAAPERSPFPYSCPGRQRGLCGARPSERRPAALAAAHPQSKLTRSESILSGANPALFPPSLLPSKARSFPGTQNGRQTEGRALPHHRERTHRKREHSGEERPARDVL